MLLNQGLDVRRHRRAIKAHHEELALYSIASVNVIPGDKYFARRPTMVLHLC
jgi:hypothetical protein